MTRPADLPPGADTPQRWPLAQTLAALAAGELDSPAGETAALCGALAAALTAAMARQMDAAVTDGAVAQADALRARLCRLAETTGPVHHRARRLLERAEMGLPRDEESDLRNRELASALREAAEYPLDICEAAAEVVLLAAWVVRDGPAEIRADALVAAFTAEAAVASAAALVEVNLAVLPDDALAEEARAHTRRASAARKSLEARV